MEDKTFIYFGRWLNADYGQGFYSEIALVTLPRDRWRALGLVRPDLYPSDEDKPLPAINRGSVWSALVQLPADGCRVVLNADDNSGITLEIASDNFQLLPEFSGEKNGSSKSHGGIECPVTWPRGDLSSLGGKVVRLKINMAQSEGVDLKLFAVYLRQMLRCREHPAMTLLRFSVRGIVESCLSMPKKNPVG